LFCLYNNIALIRPPRTCETHQRRFPASRRLLQGTQRHRRRNTNVGSASVSQAPSSSRAAFGFQWTCRSSTTPLIPTLFQLTLTLALLLLFRLSIVEPTFRCGRWDEYQIYQDCVYFKHPNGTLIYPRDIQCGFPVQTTNSAAHSYPCCSVLCCICASRSCSMLLRPILSHSVLCRSVLCVPCRTVPFCSGSWGGICFCVVFH
jgi:hypothetical protein